MSTEPIASLEYDRSEIATSVASIDITDDLSFREAGAWLLTVKAYLDRVAEVFTPIVAAGLAEDDVRRMIGAHGFEKTGEITREAYDKKPSA